MAVETAAVLPFHREAPAASAPRYCSSAPRYCSSAPRRRCVSTAATAGGWCRAGKLISSPLPSTTASRPRMRHPLCRVGTGDLIAGGLGNGDRTVIAVGHLDTTVIALSRDDLAAWPVERQAELIDRWLGQLAAATFGDLPAWPQFAAEPGHSVQLTDGNRLYAADGAVWVAPRSGTLSAGDGRLVLSGAMPIAAGLAVGAEEDACVEVTATAAALESGIDAAGLERFHTAILAALGGRIAEAEAAGRQRIVARSTADHGAMQGALRQLAEIGRRLPLQSNRAVSQDPEVAALAVVAADQGIELSRIPRVAARSGSPLAAAAAPMASACARCCCARPGGASTMARCWPGGGRSGVGWRCCRRAAALVDCGILPAAARCRSTRRLLPKSPPRRS
jgi:hypothetical protein